MPYLPKEPFQISPTEGTVEGRNPMIGDVSRGEVTMTLRDYFAGQALAGVAGNPNSPDQFLGFYDGKDLLAEWAYAAADAMLIAREDARLAARDQTP